ncbi:MULTISPECIES: hypothetical protein [unclassified Leptolyngbya]|uniref:hypothetical protein n=1 Tax=unclassified Leptolyngbya TaxID=2650499 RepID=UPI00168474AA|nr:MULTISPECIES: hypothetical protein [unclassified Leptolyngbya]MBD1912723.1 hypothetical protein [Leptolyngbya sp. FACHB-8]MBD2154654.1 hypothetical protein [Leptolyngbya sp. FACHB-16]
MRASTVALCTLALLSAEELSSTAIASPAETPNSAPVDVSITTEDADDLVAISALPSVAITEPESLVVGESSKKLSLLAATSSPEAPSVASTVSPQDGEQEASDTEIEPLQTSLAQPAPPDLQTVPEAVASPVSVSSTATAIAPPETVPQTLVEVMAQNTQQDADTLLDDGTPITVTADNKQEVPSQEDIEDLQDRLRNINEPPPEFGDVYEGSPAITIAVPSGYGADDGIGFFGFGFQTSVRDNDEADASANIGIGLGDADEAVGVQLSYTLASFGANRDFGAGGFNAKIHRRLGDNWSIAAGWEGFLITGDDPVDFEDSLYGAVTYVARTTPDINDPFSRVALTAGVGSGRFRTVEDIEDDNDTIGVFGSAAVRIAQPVSAIVEWTGQDLALGLSITPFRDFPLVITPALRDVAGAGDNPRLVLGAGVSFRF